MGNQDNHERPNTYGTLNDKDNCTCKLQASTIHCKVWQEQHCGAIHFECLSILGLPKKKHATLYMIRPKLKQFSHNPEATN